MDDVVAVLSWYDEEQTVPGDYVVRRPDGRFEAVIVGSEKPVIIGVFVSAVSAGEAVEAAITARVREREQMVQQFNDAMRNLMRKSDPVRYWWWQYCRPPSGEASKS